MPIEILMPALSPTMTEGTVAKWLKKEGEKVSPGEVIAEIETDKAVMEVEAVDAGIMGKIVVSAGTTNVKVNSLIAVLLEKGESKDDVDKITERYASKRVDSHTEKNLNSQLENLALEINIEQAIDTPLHLSKQRTLASPLARRIASQNKVSLDSIKGSGPYGRVIKADVLEYIESSSSVQIPQAIDSIEPISQMRRVIAKRLVESKQMIPHFYLDIECCVDELLLARVKLNNLASNSIDDAKPKYKLSINDFIIKASAFAMRAVPDINASWTNDGIIKYGNVDIAIAVGIPDGLITPIIKNADQKTISRISNEMKELIEKARSNRLKLNEFQGGGFSISNLGMYGIKSFKAIINPPQSAILAVGATSEVPRIIDGNIKMVNIMHLSLSCDHRVVDGVKAAEFLGSLKQAIENPYLLMV